MNTTPPMCLPGDRVAARGTQGGAEVQALPTES